MSSADTNLSVGIMGLTDKKWVAGAVYTLNLHRVLKLLTAETNVSSSLIHYGVKHIPKGLASADPESTYYFSHIEGQSEHTIRRGAKKLVAGFLNPGSEALESILEREQIKLLYPGMGTEVNLACKQAYWIPDFQHLRAPDNFPGKWGEGRNHYVDGLLERADTVFLSSQNAYEDVQAFRPQYASKCHVLPFVLVEDEACFSDSPERVIHGLAKGREYLIFPSQLWIHKGHDILIRALAILKETYRVDVLVLCPGYPKDERFPNYYDQLKREIRELGVEDNIQFLGLLKRDVLVQLIRGSRAVVQPSRFEGWSALVEEAQGFGKFIFASDIKVHREQDPPDTFYFEDGNPESLAESIAKQWTQLPTGFDADRETEGRARQSRRVREFGHYFAHLLRKVAD